MGGREAFFAVVSHFLMRFYQFWMVRNHFFDIAGDLALCLLKRPLELDNNQALAFN
jgi:hypothetical protein